MQTQQKTSSTLKHLPQLTSTKKIPLLLDNSFIEKVKYLCAKISDVEWSGILFYTLEGSIRDLSTLKFIAKDILPLDKGNKTYTSYSLDERLIDYMMSNEEAMSWKIGHIHSHNSMNVFFSGTDLSELHENAHSHNFYLSLIVNNLLEFEAKVATVSSVNMLIPNVVFTALDENGQSYEHNVVNFKIDKKQMNVYDCEIIADIVQPNVDKSFMNSVNEIMNRKSHAEVKKTYSNPNNFNKNVVPAHRTPVTKENFKNGKFQKASNKQHTNTAYKHVNNMPYVVSQEIMLLAKKVLLFGENSTDDVQSILNEIEILYEGMDHSLAILILESYLSVFMDFYPDSDDKNLIDKTKKLIEYFDYLSINYCIIKYVAPRLQNFINNYVQELENDNSN